MPNVYIVNKSSHNFTEAKKYGSLVFLSEGIMNRFATNNIHRKFDIVMKNSHEDDYIVPCSLNIMNSIACAIFARKHGKLNLLLYKDKKYVERNLII